MSSGGSGKAVKSLSQPLTNFKNPIQPLTDTYKGTKNMAGGGSSKDQTTTSKTEPWVAAQPALLNALGQTENAFNNAGQGYMGNTAAPLSSQTTGLIGQAVQAGYSPHSAQAGGLINDGIANGISQNANGLYNNLIGGNLGSADAARNALSQIGASNPALAQAMAGATSSAENPYLDATFNKAAAAVRDNYSKVTMPSLESSFSQAGRLGSGAFAYASDSARKSVDQNVSDLATSIYGGAYEADANRRLNYTSLAGSLAQGDKSNMLAATGLLQSGLSSDLAAQLQGATGAQGISSTGFGQNLAGANALLGMDTNTLNNSLNALKASGVLDQQAQNDLDSMIQQTNQKQNPDLQRLTTYLPLLQAFGGMGTSGTVTAPITGPSKTTKALGGAASGAAMGATVGGPYGAVIGGVAGGLYGYFG